MPPGTHSIRVKCVGRLFVRAHYTQCFAFRIIDRMNFAYCNNHADATTTHSVTILMYMIDCFCSTPQPAYEYLRTATV